MRYLLSLMISCVTILSSAQTDTTSTRLKISGYAELYYAYDFNQPQDHTRPWFLYNHTRHNEVNVNLAFLRAAYTSERMRAQLSLATGTYMNANYASEPGVLQNIFEGFAGYKLSRKHNLWLDAGIFPSHLGFEGAVSMECSTLTRSLSAEGSPYYESGISVVYLNPSGTWFFRGLWLNGWQHIQRPDGNNTPAFGSQITFTPSSRFKINYATFWGNDKPDDVRQYRFFQDLYATFGLTSWLNLTTGFDFGMQESATSGQAWNYWYTPTLVLQARIDDPWYLALRVEYFSDPDEVIVTTGTPNGFQTWGGSLNLDYHIQQNMFCRIEGRYFKSTDALFTRQGSPLDSNFALTSSLAVSF